MDAPARVLTSGRGRWWSPAVVYLFGLLVVYLGGVVIGTIERGEPSLLNVAYRPALFPVLFLYAPPAFAAVAAFRGYAPIASLALGHSVGLGFAGLGGLAALLGTSGIGDAPHWAMSLAFAGIGLVGAVAGHAVGLLGRLALDRLA